MKEVVLGIDIGGTNTVFGVVDRDGNILLQHRIPTVVAGELYGDFIRRIAGEVARIRLLQEECTMVGVGVGAPDANYYTGSIEHPANLPWKGVSELVETLSSLINIPVALTNDANAAALGEMLFGGAQGCNDFVVITLGTGVGSGVVINGHVLYGKSGSAGEIGHCQLIPEGRDCGCGRRGCVETYVSATGICRTALALMADRMDDSLLRSILPSALSSKKIFQAAKEGDTLALEAFEKTGAWLAQALADTVAFSSPEKIFLFGGLANAGSLLLDAVNRHFDDRCLESLKGTAAITFSSLKEADAAILGAAALIWDSLGEEA